MNFGGQQTFMHNVLKRVQLDDVALHTVFVFDGDMKDKYRSISINTQQIGHPYDPFDVFKKKRIIIKIIYDLVKYIKNHKIELVYSNGFCSFFCTSFATLLTGVKHIRIIGGDLTKNEPFHFNNWKFNVLPPHWLTDKYYGNLFILDKMCEKGVPRSKLLPLFRPGGVDTELFKPSLTNSERLTLREKLGIACDNLVIGWLGRIESNMEIRYTLELIRKLKERGLDRLTFLVLGDGAWKDSFFNRVEEYGLTKNIVYMGYLSQKEIPQFLEIMDIMPLLDVDPIGGSLIREAMACGTAVLSVDGKSGEQRQIIEHNITGILVSPQNFVSDAADICLRLYAEPEKIKAQGVAARKFALEKMSFRNISRKLEKEIQSLLSIQ